MSWIGTRTTCRRTRHCETAKGQTFLLMNSFWSNYSNWINWDGLVLKASWSSLMIWRSKLEQKLLGDWRAVIGLKAHVTWHVLRRVNWKSPYSRRTATAHCGRGCVRWWKTSDRPTRRRLVFPSRSIGPLAAVAAFDLLAPPDTIRRLDARGTDA